MGFNNVRDSSLPLVLREFGVCGQLHWIHCTLQVIVAVSLMSYSALDQIVTEANIVAVGSHMFLLRTRGNA